jgi:hypothetical protein
VEQLGELAIATGADNLSADKLAGALIVLAATKDTAMKEAWAKRDAAFFQSRARRTAPATERDTAAFGRNRRLATVNNQKARRDVRTWQVECRKRTRHLIELGGLVVKSGIVDLTGDDRATIFGALLWSAGKLKTGTTSSIWLGAGLGPIREAACWLHARRPLFALADVEENARRKAAGNKEIRLSTIAIEVVRRIDALFERSINGKSSEERLQLRQTLSRPLVKDLQIICANSSPSCRGDMSWPRHLILSDG